MRPIMRSYIVESCLLTAATTNKTTKTVTVRTINNIAAIKTNDAAMPRHERPPCNSGLTRPDSATGSVLDQVQILQPVASSTRS
jgi:hypothetical protein